MRKTFGMLTGAMVLTAAMAAGAAAQEAPRGKQAGDLVVGLGVIGVVPANGGNVTGIGGTPQVDVSYFLLPNVALNLIAATSEHDLSVRGSALGDVKLGHVWALPPTLTVQYHPFPAARFSPYAGLGVNYTFFYGYGGEKTAPVTRVRVDGAPGFAMVAGVDYEVAPNWLVNFDVKKILLRPDASVNSGLVRANVTLDPWIIGAAVRYRF